MYRLNEIAENGKQKIRYTPTERSYFRREGTGTNADNVKNAAIAANDEMALALAARLFQCSLKSNHFLAQDLIVDRHGESLEGFGVLWGCGSKLCPSCLARSGSRNRAQSREAIENTRLEKVVYYAANTAGQMKRFVEWERYRFVTLAMPRIETTCIGSLQILSAAWGYFRKRKFFKHYIRGCVKAGEFTVRVDETYHAHLHLLAISLFIPEAEIKKVWAQCVRRAFTKFGIDYEQATAHLADADKLNVNLKYVDSIENGLNEVCKYLTKNESWSLVPDAHLLEIANVERFPRMFELCGRLKETAQAIKAQKETWKTLSTFFIAQPTMAIVKGLAVEILDAAMSETVNQDAPEYYKDTNGITDGGNKILVETDTPNESDRAESWRKLVPEHGIVWYLEHLTRQYERSIGYRKQFLREKYPHATFKDHDGVTWHKPDIEFDEILDTEFIDDEKLHKFYDAHAAHYQTERAELAFA
jgi:hypothetical protein